MYLRAGCARKRRVSYPAQRGNMVLIAVFAIVVMGMLAASLSRIQWSNQDSLSREFLGAQAWLLAHSGNEWALTELFPADQEDSPQALLSRCQAINASAGEAAAEHLVGHAQLACQPPVIICTSPPLDSSDPSQLAADIPEALQYYKLQTTAICGLASRFQVQRRQEVWVKGVKE